MPDPTPAGETPQNPPAAPQNDNQPAPETGPDGKPFDAARAMSTIEALRAEIKGLKGTSKDLEAAQAKLKEYEQAQLSETERLTAQLADANAKAADLESKYQAALIRTAVEREAAKAGAVDPEVVYALIDRANVKLDDSGAVTGADKAVKALLDAKSYLKAPEGTTATAATKSVPATPKPTGTASTREELVKKTQQELAGSGRYRM